MKRAFALLLALWFTAYSFEDRYLKLPNRFQSITETSEAPIGHPGIEDFAMTKEEEATKAFEIIRPYLSQVNSTPELLSLLYDIDMLPEQTVTVPGAIRLVAFCCLWERMADAEREKAEATGLQAER